MCGRTCLTLEPGELQCCCKFKKTPDSKPKAPEYRNEFNCGKKYQPSFNLAPTDVSPVLVSAKHFSETKTSDERMLVPMMWGMVPRWHKGDYRKHGLTTNNCRLESLSMSKLYGPTLAAGQRCVIVCEGFYEWQTIKELKASDRPAFYVHMPQDDEKIKMEDKQTWDLANGGLKLLKMAGLFDVWNDSNGDKLYSYTVITYETEENKFSSIHHRIPAILETEQQVADWLDFERISSNHALNLLQPCHNLKWYRVSNLVNNSRNKSDKCNKPLKLTESSGSKAVIPKSKMMQSWLIVKKRPLGEMLDDKEQKHTKVKEEKEEKQETDAQQVKNEEPAGKKMKVEQFDKEDS